MFPGLPLIVDNWCSFCSLIIKQLNQKQMKVTEQKTKSLTFIFNKDEEYDSFVRLLSEGKHGIESRGDVSASDSEVILSLNRNVFAGYPFAPRISVGDQNGPYYQNEQGQWVAPQAKN